MKTDLVGTYVIVRCRDAGVHAGILLGHEGREATLAESRRLWYWKAKAPGKYLSGVAVYGLDGSSKLGEPITVHLTETCEIIACTPEAADSIRSMTSDRR